MHPTQSKEPAEIGGKQGEEVRGAMELYHQYFSDGGYRNKEKRLPLKRVSSSGRSSGPSASSWCPAAAADRTFRREPSNN